MSRYQSLGYNQPSESVLTVSEIELNGTVYDINESSESGINLSNWWTPSKETSITGLVRVNIADIYRDCNLDREDVLELCVNTYCLGTRLRHKSKVYEVKNTEVPYLLVIPDGEWNDSAVLSFSLSVNLNPKALRKIGSPVLNKSILLKKDIRFQLAGQETQGNVIIRDFSNDKKVSKALWKIQIDPTVGIDDWVTVEHSRMLRVEINKKSESSMRDKNFQAMLLADIVMIALGSSINDDDKLDLIRNENIVGGSWLRFLRSAFSNVFETDELSVRDKWNQNQSSIRARVQHVMMENVEGAK
jgi:hypothetical protein